MRAISIPIVASLLATTTSGQTAEETFELDPLVANANRIEASGSYAQSAVSTIGLPDLDLGQFRDISDALASYPGIASYRRTHAVAAHPTTQGVRLRNFGANATSRSLVLYNGVPQNDPFGGWIYWHQYDLSQVEALLVYPSGIAETWGNMASGGLVSMIAREPAAGARSFEASVGSSNRYDFKAYFAESVGQDAVLDIGLHRFDTDGFETLDETQRGEVDQAAFSSANSLNTRLSFKSGDNWKSQIAFRLLDEERGNGTPLARNSTQALDLSWIAEREIPAQDATLNLNVYLQDRDFENVFTSVEDDRSSERPALDQYEVPAHAMGGAAIYRSDRAKDTRYSAGVDFRVIEGSVNERFRNLGSGFTRERYADGEQEFIGLFTQVESQLSGSDELSVTTRIERVRRSAGRRIETNTDTNSILQDNQYPDSSDTIVSGNLNWLHRYSESISSQLALFSGYRAPTLNELYRPFRVRNDITEANPDLANERHQGLELTLQNESVDGRSSLRLSGFYYEADEMVANALFTTQSGFDPRFGFIPEGGSGSARVNLDRSIVSGFELHGTQRLTNSLQASLAAVYAETEIRADERSELNGNAFPQSAPWKAVASLDWTATEKLTLWTNYRWYDRSWENLSNTRRLGATADLAVGARYRIDESRSLSLTVTNALDEKNVTGIATNGLLTIDEPREIQLTFRWKK